MNEPSWGRSDHYKDFSNALREEIKAHILTYKSTLTTDHLNYAITNIQRELFNAWVQSKPELEAKAAEIWTKIPQWLTQRVAQESRVRRKLTKDELTKVITVENIQTMLTFLNHESLVKRVDHLETHVVPSATQSSSNQTPDRPRLPQGCRKRNFWTPEEDAILLEGKDLDNLNWVDIAKNLPNRSNVDCKDRYRSIMKSRSRQRLN